MSFDPPITRDVNGPESHSYNDVSLTHDRVMRNIP